ncbi:MAG TPA: hypothetical protein P5572_21865, partial [Phycisphaerae bacterium]|nr:hypothetical protein [Phycisphaerae bacterium]
QNVLMETPTEPKRADAPRTGTSLFAYRLTAGIAAGLALLLTLHTCHLALVRIPAIRDVLADFDTTLPPLTVGLFHFPWLPAATALVALAATAAALFCTRRLLLVTAWILLLLSMAVTLVAQYALTAPLYRLIQSLTGE